MTALAEGIFHHLTNDSGVAALAGTRVYPLMIPQDATLPAIAYQVISDVPQYSHEGTAGLSRARVQITCVGDNYAASKSLAAAVRTALSGYRGTMDALTVGAVLLENDRDDYAGTFSNPGVRQDYVVWYEE